MIGDATFISKEQNTAMGHEDREDLENLNVQILKLSGENENYRQELHELYRKLETSKTMEDELSELNRVLEQSLDGQKALANRRIHEIEEKHAADAKMLQERLIDMEAELAKKSKENKDLLHQITKMNDEKLLALSQTQSMIIDDNSEYLKSQIEELKELLATEEEIRKQSEESMKAMEKESDELREILTATKRQLTEKNKITESMRGELFDCRMELESLKTAPATDKSKGNSLFAEVEDRRKTTLDKMTAMKNSYLEAKRSFQAKEAEIRSLKSERALLLRKWEDDTVEKIQQDASLMEKYKDRISSLERQLREEQKKQAQLTKSQKLPKSDFTFLQSLVNAKSKEIEELSKKIENDSIKALLEEENKHKMGKQLRYWRYRAMTDEAELLSIKNRLERDPSTSRVEILETIKSRLNEKKSDPQETIEIEASYRESTIINDTIVTLEKLMTIPTSLNIEIKDETIDSLTVSGDESLLSIERTMINENSTRKSRSMERESKEKSIEIVHEVNEMGKKSTDQEKNIEIDSDCCIIEEPALKSMLAKPNDDIILTSKEANERDKKTLRFTNDTIDPPSKTLKKLTTSTPQYPIVFISSNKSKHLNDVERKF